MVRKERRWSGRRDAGQEEETLVRKERRWPGRRDAGQEEETLVNEWIALLAAWLVIRISKGF